MFRIVFSVKKGYISFFKELRESSLDYKNLSSQEKKEINKNQLRYFVSIGISFCVHVLFLMSILHVAVKPKSSSEGVEIPGDVVDFELTEGMVSQDVHPVYDPDSQVIIKPALLQKNTEDKQTLRLNNLLNTLKKDKGPVLSAVFQPHVKSRSALRQKEKKLMASLKVKSLKRPKRPKRQTLSQREGLWNQVRMLKSNQTEPVDINNTELMKVIDRHSFQFRDCYEKALLKDEKLSVRATFLLKLNQSQVRKTRVELSGTGNSASRRSLSHCLFQQSKALVFSKNKQDLSLRFNLIFGL